MLTLKLLLIGGLGIGGAVAMEAVTETPTPKQSSFVLRTHVGRVVLEEPALLAQPPRNGEIHFVGR